MFGFAAAGWIAHSAYLYHQIVLQSGHLFDSVQGWLFAVAWVLAASYLYLVVYFPKTPFGLCLLPLVLISIGVGVHFADASSFPADSVGQTWRIIHGVAFLLVTVVIFLGFVIGMMYLVQASNLKHKRPMLGRWRLPTLEWLQTTNSRLIGFLMVLLAVGIMSGFAINSINLSGQRSSVSLFDPMVLVTMAMFVFLLLFAIATRRSRTREGQQQALVTLICFAAMIIMLTFGILSSTAHWNLIKPSQNEPAPAESPVGVCKIISCSRIAAPSVSAGVLTRHLRFGLLLTNDPVVILQTPGSCFDADFAAHSPLRKVAS
jgi:hypothetical protein